VYDVVIVTSRVTSSPSLNALALLER